MQITWDVDGIEVQIWISNIQWDNDSIGMSEVWGFLKDDDRDDYISDFDIDTIEFVGDNDADLYQEQCTTIDEYKWHEDADFVAKLEDIERYG